MIAARERLEAVFNHAEPDRTPILGGWIACPEHICTLVGIDLDTYWADPLSHSIDAYNRLNTDGLISCFVPRNRIDYRCVDADSYPHAVSALSLEESLERIDSWDAPETIEAEFDFDTEYEYFEEVKIKVL